MNLGYVFSPLREGDFNLYRDSCNGMAPILLVAAEDASPWSFKRLEHTGKHLSAFGAVLSKYAHAS
jgi:hypothetical protein